jgi:hypothetical protein
MKNAKAIENTIYRISQQLLNAFEELERLDMRYETDLAQRKRAIESKIDEMNPMLRLMSEAISSL